MLGRIWLRQRGFRGTISEGGFGHFEWAVLTALLLQSGGPKGQAVLSPGYSSYQLFKAVMQYLASNDLAANPVLFRAPGVPLSKTGCPTFYDSPREHNVLFKMTAWSYAMLHEEANISIEMLNNIACDQFEAMFIIRKDNILQQYDSLLTLPVPKVIEEQRNGDHMCLTARFASNVYAILKEGLTDRVKNIRLMVPSCASWSLRASGPRAHSDILVGFIFDPVTVGRVVDHGPAAESGRDAARFQKFWGEKAELRRFKDGSIIESLVWSHDSDRPVFRDIVTYLLRRHLGADIGEKIKFIDYEISQLLPDSERFTKAYSNLRAAFNILEQDLRGVEGLPLQLKFLSATNSQLRFCSVQPSIFNPGHYLTDPADVLVQFEGSGRWPDNVLAIQRTKIALLLKIGKLLEASVDSIVTRLGLENANRALCNCAFLDIIYPSGAAFRLRIYIDREQFLLEHMLKEHTSAVHAREEIIAARSLFAFRYVQLPLHTQSMTTHCTRYPMLSPTIRLVKKWFSSHMLSSHIREEVIELIVMHIFLQPYPWRAPSSAVTGFWRVLQFISRWDWRVTPLIVDFSGSMLSRDLAAIHTKLTAWRKIDPAMNRMVLFVASNHDTTGTVFTDGGPSKVVAARMTALARSAWRVANRETTELDMRNVFKCSTKDYNFIIHISARFTCDRSSEDGNQRLFKNLRLQDNGDISHLGYEPVQLFLSELEMLYTTSIVFFHNPLERSIIAGVWNPQTTSRPFKVNIPYGIKPIAGSSVQEEDQLVEIDKPAILSDIARLGGDLVSKIEIHP
jgi:U3 small nucleolar RNA-associated protein 22